MRVLTSLIHAGRERVPRMGEAPSASEPEAIEHACKISIWLSA